MPLVSIHMKALSLGMLVFTYCIFSTWELENLSNIFISLILRKDTQWFWWMRRSLGLYRENKKLKNFQLSMMILAYFLIFLHLNFFVLMLTWFFSSCIGLARERSIIHLGIALHTCTFFHFLQVYLLEKFFLCNSCGFVRFPFLQGWSWISWNFTLRTKMPRTWGVLDLNYHELLCKVCKLTPRHRQLI